MRRPAVVRADAVLLRRAGRSIRLAQSADRPDVATAAVLLGRDAAGRDCRSRLADRRLVLPARHVPGALPGRVLSGRLDVRPNRVCESATVGGGYTGQVEPFAQSVGDSGFAPTGLAVEPVTGDLFVSTGGRGTRGAVYRIQCTTPRTDSPRMQVSPPSDALRELCPRNVSFPRSRTNRLYELVRTHVSHGDRWVRQAAARLAARVPPAILRQQLRQEKSLVGRIALGTAALHSSPDEARRVALDVLSSVTARAEDRLDATRLLQLSFGDLTDPKSVGTAFEGYTPRRRSIPVMSREAASRVRSLLPSGHSDLDRELSRTLAMLADDDPIAVEKVISTLTADSDPVADVHTLIVLSRLRSEHTPAQSLSLAAALLRVVEKADSKSIPRDRHWPIRLAEAAAALAKKDPALAPALLDSPEFGKAGHVVFAQLPGLDRRAAARRFLKQSAVDRDYGWLPEHVGLLAELPVAEVRDTLLRLWDRGGFQDSLIPILARNPVPADRDRFIAGLRSHQSKTIAVAARALRTLSGVATSNELVSLIAALRSLPSDETESREQLALTLRQRTGEDYGADARAWSDWATRHRPDVAKGLSTTGVDVNQTRKRLAGIDWQAGDTTSGRAVFAKATCAACHNGALAVGPSLEGVANRFSRDDLITAVIDPSRDVSPRYRVTKVSTQDGQIYLGVIVYEANDGLILQTGAADTIRVAGSRVQEKRPGETSLMPAGLLDRLSDREVADLFAYMKSLGKPTAQSEQPDK